MAAELLNINGALSIEFDTPTPMPQNTTAGLTVPGYNVPCFFVYGNSKKRIGRLQVRVGFLGNKQASLLVMGDELGERSGPLRIDFTNVQVPADFDDSAKQPAFDPEWQQKLIDVLVKPTLAQLS